MKDKKLEERLSDWQELHNLFVVMRGVREQNKQLEEEYVLKADTFQKKYGVYANPLLRPR